MPRRKPTEQKRTEGTLRPDRSNAAEPKLRPGVPPSPKWLAPDALVEWRRVAPLLDQQRVLSEADMAVLAVYCEMVAEVGALSAALRAGRKFLVEEQGQPRKYPLAKERREAIARLQSLAGELGLSPASRSKVSSLAEAGAEDPLDAILKEAAASAAAPPN